MTASSVNQCSVGWFQKSSEIFVFQYFTVSGGLKLALAYHLNIII